MNHYPHHVGDFNNATRHLTFVERALYRELLDLYYDTEQPLNADATKLARRVLAHTDEQREALRVVLEEFFVLEGDGWHNARCDREIQAYHQKQEQQSRAGRASAAKRGKGAGSREGGNKRSTATPRNPSSGEDGGSTTDERTFNDRSTNQNQNHIKETSSPKADDGATVVCCDPATVPASPAAWAVLFGEEFGVEVHGTDAQARKKFWPLATAWVAAGVSAGQMRQAVAKARSEATEGIAYLPAYVDRVLASMSAPPPESRAEAAARARMQQAAPLAAAHAPASAAAPIPAADGYRFFQQQAAGLQALPAMEVIHA